MTIRILALMLVVAYAHGAAASQRQIPKSENARRDTPTPVAATGSCQGHPGARPATVPGSLPFKSEAQLRELDCTQLSTFANRLRGARDGLSGTMDNHEMPFRDLNQVMEQVNAVLANEEATVAQLRAAYNSIPVPGSNANSIATDVTENPVHPDVGSTGVIAVGARQALTSLGVLDTNYACLIVVGRSKQSVIPGDNSCDWATPANIARWGATSARVRARIAGHRASLPVQNVAAASDLLRQLDVRIRAAERAERRARPARD